MDLLKPTNLALGSNYKRLNLILNFLVFGAGAIGSHIGYCAHRAGHSVSLVCRGKHLEAIRKNGLKISIFSNDIKESEKIISERTDFRVYDTAQAIQDEKFDYIFICPKLTDYNASTLEQLQHLMGDNTAVVPPCTNLPFWWFYNLPPDQRQQFNNIDFMPDIGKFFIKENIICVTQWLSAVIEDPGETIIKHVQRGYPLSALYPKMSKKASLLRQIFTKTCKSPIVADIRSEIFIKAINSFAFNLVAISKEYNNYELNQDRPSKESVAKIMHEGDQILETLNIPIIQSVDSRISQTLSSTKHTMSMLHSFLQRRPIELEYQWESFSKVSKILELDMPYTRKIYNSVKKKIESVYN
tara:strand:+ start:4387 stop:5454 length:1068 start_codon:yes stop_codon:yes gene_type:complete